MHSLGLLFNEFSFKKARKSRSVALPPRGHTKTEWRPSGMLKKPHWRSEWPERRTEWPVFYTENEKSGWADRRRKMETPQMAKRLCGIVQCNIIHFPVCVCSERKPTLNLPRRGVPRVCLFNARFILTRGPLQRRRAHKNNVCSQTHALTPVLQLLAQGRTCEKKSFSHMLSRS